MTKHILAIIAFAGLFSCGQQKSNGTITNVKVEDTYKPAFSVDQINDKLERAFRQSQPDSFRQVFIDWNKIGPNADDFIYQNDTINSIFNIYKEFYKPLDLLELGDWEWGNDLNAGCQYVAVQNKVFYSVLTSDSLDDYDWERSRKDSIANFRPPIDLDKSKTLYLTDSYANAINKFLGGESTELGEENIMDPSKPKGESEKRYKMLRSYIPVLHGHWGGYWHLETHPAISIIILNKTLTKAAVNFRVGYQGGEATLTRNGEGWTIEESRATWIE